MFVTTKYRETVHAPDARVYASILEDEFKGVLGKHQFIVDEAEATVTIEVTMNFAYNERFCKEFYDVIERAQRAYERYEEWKKFHRLFEAFGSKENESP